VFLITKVRQFRFIESLSVLRKQLIDVQADFQTLIEPSNTRSFFMEITLFFWNSTFSDCVQTQRYQEFPKITSFDNNSDYFLEIWVFRENQGQNRIQRSQKLLKKKIFHKWLY